MRPVSPFLEDFGDPGRKRKSEAERRLEEAVARARGEGHAAGYAEGYAAAAKEAETEDRAAATALAEAARDLAFERAAARAEALSALGPVLRAMIHAAAPRAAASGLADAVAEAAASRLEAAPEDALVAHVAPDRVESLARRLGEAVAVRADPALGPAEARLDWSGGGLVFDAAGALSAAQAALSDWFGAEEDDPGAGMADAAAEHGPAAIDAEENSDVG